MKERGVESDFITAKSGLSRINMKVRSDDETEINGMGPRISDEDIDKLYVKLDNINDGDILVLAGSIPSVMPETMYSDIMKRLSDKNLKIAVDATKDLLVNVLKYHPFLVKPNNSLEYLPAQNFDNTARIVITIMNQMSLIKLANVMDSPIFTKKTGIKME